jgi:hypothetical protein
LVGSEQNSYRLQAVSCASALLHFLVYIRRPTALELLQTKAKRQEDKGQTQAANESAQQEDSDQEEESAQKAQQVEEMHKGNSIEAMQPVKAMNDTASETYWGIRKGVEEALQGLTRPFSAVLGKGRVQDSISNMVHIIAEEMLHCMVDQQLARAIELTGDSVGQEGEQNTSRINGCSTIAETRGAIARTVCEGIATSDGFQHTEIQGAGTSRTTRSHQQQVATRAPGGKGVQKGQGLKKTG